MPEKDFEVADIPLLVGRSIRDRLRVLQQIEQAGAQTRVANKDIASERLQLLHLGIQLYLALLGVAGNKLR